MSKPANRASAALVHVLITLVVRAALASSFDCPEPFGLFADASDCGAFHACAFGSPVTRRCDDGLHFHEEAGGCNWPERIPERQRCRPRVKVVARPASLARAAMFGLNENVDVIDAQLLREIKARRQHESTRIRSAYVPATNARPAVSARPQKVTTESPFLDYYEYDDQNHQPVITTTTTRALRTRPTPAPVVRQHNTVWTQRSTTTARPAFNTAPVRNQPRPVQPQTRARQSTARPAHHYSYEFVAVNETRARPTNRRQQAQTYQDNSRQDNSQRASTEFATAVRCDERVCRLPHCRCGSANIPGQLPPERVPQMVLLTFDDAVNDLNWELYEELLTGHVNPDGCPIRACFFVSHDWTDYAKVQTLYSRGHEMASHTVTHSHGEKFSVQRWTREVDGQRKNLAKFGGVQPTDVRGMRAPFLQTGGDQMFASLFLNNFTYDSSLPVPNADPPFWPYTLDHRLAHDCMIAPCPTKSFPGLWEVGMTMWSDLRGGRCSMADACTNPTDEDGVFKLLQQNFERHYNSNRAPFGLYYHSAWFSTPHHKKGFLRFFERLLTMPDVFFVTPSMAVDWTRFPQPLESVERIWPCQAPQQSECLRPTTCGSVKTCQRCEQ